MSVLLALSTLLACGEPGPPDVLLVTIDTLRADAVGAYGGEAATPVMDKLAAEGILYERAYTPTPLTIPAHATVHTGQRPPRHGVRDNGDFVLAEGALTLAEAMKTNGYRTAASIGAAVTSRKWGFGQGFDAYFEEMPDGEVSNEWWVERGGDVVIADALRWWTDPADGSDAPRFMWVHLFEPHHPYEPPEPYASEYPDAPYLGEVAWVDALLGRLLAQVDLDRTLVVVASDHGEGLGERGEKLHGVLLHNATTHVPMIIRPHEGARRRRVARPVGLVDIAPTVIAAIGAPPMPGVDGVALGLDGAEPPRRGVYMESLYVWRRYAWAPQYGLATTEYKLIDSTTPELYRADDFEEEEDLAAREPRTVATLRGQADDLREAGEAAMLHGATAPVSDATQRQLEALGYTVAEGDPSQTEGLPDPASRMEAIDRITRADQLIHKGDLGRARAELEALLAEDPGLATTKVSLARVVAKMGEPERALVLIDEALEHIPSAIFLGERADVLLSMGREKEALADMREAVEMSPSQEATWNLYLSFLFKRNQHSELARALAKAERYVPDSRVFRSTRAHALVMRKELDEAERVFEGLLAEQPGYPMASYGLGVIHHMRGDLESAEAALAQELRDHPTSSIAIRMLFGIYSESGRSTEASALVEACLARAPEDPTCRRLAGKAGVELGSQGDPSAAPADR